MAPSPKATLQTWTKLRQWNNLWFLSVRSCSRYQFECRTSGECIAIYNACDGIPQCADGSDEAAELGCPATSKRQSQSFCWFAFTVFLLDRFFFIGCSDGDDYDDKMARDHTRSRSEQIGYFSRYENQCERLAAQPRSICSSRFWQRCQQRSLEDIRRLSNLCRFPAHPFQFY